MALAYPLPSQLVDPLYGHPHYRSLQGLGSGAYGCVIKALDLRDKRQYAIKVINQRHLTKYVEYELVNHSLLRHPHIIQFKEVFVYGQYVCVVMEYASGGTLLRHVQMQTNGRLEEKIARWFFQQLMIGVEYCHESGVVNRDLKPENILLHKFEDLPLPVVKICDFGYSKSDSKSKPKSQVGTLAYMAPEVLLSRDTSQYDGKLADIWSCGVMLYVMLYGRHPFDSSSSSTYDVKTVVRIIDKMVNQAYPRYEDVRISSACSDLLGRLLQPMPTNRITLREIVQHRWFVQNIPEEAAGMNRIMLRDRVGVSHAERTHQIRALLSTFQGRVPTQLDMSPPKPLDDDVMDYAIWEEVQHRRVSTNLLQYMHELEHGNKRRSAPAARR